MLSVLYAHVLVNDTGSVYRVCLCLVGVNWVLKMCVSYGMTENCGSFVRTWTYDPTSSGTVGSPLVNCELKLIDVPSMGYTAEDKPYPRGEICMRGEQRFSCYYKGACDARRAHVNASR